MKKKKENKQIVKKTSLEVKKENLEQIKKYFSDPELFYHEEKKLTAYINNSKRNSSKDIFGNLAIMYSLENGAFVKILSRGKYGPALLRIRKKIIDENDCKSSIELMLVDRIVASYWKSMRSNSIYDRLAVDDNDTFSFNQITLNALKEFNNSIDHANRELSNNIILLKELKQPNLKLTVKTDNAYFAENQQVINNKDGENLKTNTEIIKDK